MIKLRNRAWLRSWEALLTVILILVVIYNLLNSPFFLHGDNLINLFGVSIEKIIVALAMTFVIINGEIDLSVASIMGLTASLCAWLTIQGMDFALALLVSMSAGLVCGLINGFFVAYLNLPSLAVTLAGLIGFHRDPRLV